MDRLRDILRSVKSGINEEVSSLKKLKGSKLETFKDVFNLDEEVHLYYNEYNLIIIDDDLHEKLSYLFKKGALILKVEIPEHNSYLWVYQYFNDQIFESYLIDSVKLPS